jgi:glycosyltransferase involved in cell wall biosynthesis
MDRQLTVMSLQPDSHLYGALRSLLRVLTREELAHLRVIAVFPSDGPGVQAYRAAGAEVIVEPSLAVLRRQHMHPGGVVRLAGSVVLSAWRLRQLTRRLGIDVLHSNSGYILSGGALGALRVVPHVWHLREWPVNKPFRALLKVILPLGADVVGTVSSRAAEVVGPPRATPIPNGYDVPYGSAVGRRRNLITCLGRISRTKGQLLLVRALAMCKDRLPEPWETWIVGACFPGNERADAEVREAIGRSGLAGKVHMLGYVERTSELLDRTDVVVVPSIGGEGFCNVALEAMAHGALVVSAAEGGIDDLVIDGRTGLRARPNDPGSLADALVAALSQDRDADREIRGRAALHARSYSVKASARALDRALRRAAD